MRTAFHHDRAGLRRQMPTGFHTPSTKVHRHQGQKLLLSMKLSKLLAIRQAALRQAQLANLAYAYATLDRFATRITNANLRGLVRLCPADPEEERFWASLKALEGSQAVLEEHFADHELIEFADAMAYAAEGEFEELDFRLEDLQEQYLAPVRQMLELAGIDIDVAAREQPNLAADSSDPQFWDRQE